jgi:hypothetical protein
MKEDIVLVENWPLLYTCDQYQILSKQFYPWTFQISFGQQCVYSVLNLPVFEERQWFYLNAKGKILNSFIQISMANQENIKNY